MRQGWRRLDLGGRAARVARPLAVVAVAAGTVLAGSAAVSAPAVGVPLPTPATAAPTAAAAHAPVTYGGWAAGYTATAPAGHGFTAVSTRFILPKAGPVDHPSDGTPAWVSIWTGIGIEAHTGELMQAGVSLLAAPGGGWQLAAPWWINEPQSPTEPHALSVSVSPGDTVQVDVRQVDAAAHTWVFVVQDVTAGTSASGWCYGCTADERTAAWVEEDPLDGRSPAAFADPGRVAFVGAEAAVDGGALRPLGGLAWHPLIRTLSALTRYVPLDASGNGAVVPADAGGQAPAADSTDAGGAGVQGPLAVPSAGGAFTVGELRPVGGAGAPTRPAAVE